MHIELTKQSPGLVDVYDLKPGNEAGAMLINPEAARG